MPIAAPRSLWGVASESIASRSGVKGRKQVFKPISAKVRYNGVLAKKRHNSIVADRKKPESTTCLLPTWSETQPKSGVARNPDTLATDNRAPISRVDMPTDSEA